MLKWTVNAKRSDLAMGENPFEVNLNMNNNNTNMRDLPSHRTRRSLGAYPRLSVGKENLVNCKPSGSPRTPLSRQHRRQSLGVLLSQSKKSRIPSSEADKENNNNNNNINSFVLSPPLKANIYGAFRDVSNITPTSTPTSNTVSSQRRKRSLSQLQASNTPALLTDVRHHAHPAQYASTLPTFDIEYSPFGLRHKPFLDTYYNQPRYITPQVVPRQQQPEEEDEEEEYVAPASKKPKIVHSQKAKAKSPSEPPMTPLTHRLNDVAMCDSTPAKMSSNQKRPRKFFFMNNNNNNNSSSITKLNDDEESPTSADVGDLTLDHMIDAILESARKEPTRKITSRRRFSCNFKLDKPKQLEEFKSHFGRVKEPSTFESPTYTAADDPASDLQEEFLRCSPTYLSAIVEQEQQQQEEQQMETMERTMIGEEQTVMFNEREVKTPDSVVKRQTGGTETLATVTVGDEVENREVVAEEDCALRRQNALRRKTAKNFKPIGLTLPNGIPSPGTPASVRQILDETDTPYNMELASMDTPKVPIRIEETTSTDSDSHLIFDDFTPGMKSNELRASSTPTISTSCGNLSEGITRRYLQFSPEFEDLTNIERRRSVASSTNSRYGKNVVVSGSLDLAILTEGNKLIVHGEWLMVMITKMELFRIISWNRLF